MKGVAEKRKGGFEKLTPVTWSEQFRWREKVHQQYPEIWNLRIVRKRLPFIAPLLTYVMKVYLFCFLFRFLTIDFTKSILLVARKV